MTIKEFIEIAHSLDTNAIMNKFDCIYLHKDTKINNALNEIQK